MPSKPFNPDYAASPGLVLEIHLESCELSVSDFAQRCGLPVEFVQEIISGVAPLDRKTALLFEREFSISADTWLGVEAEYRQKLARDAEKLARRKAMWRHFGFLRRILSSAGHALGRIHRHAPRQG